jgi:hypothetical protein
MAELQSSILVFLKAGKVIFPGHQDMTVD